MIVSGKRKSARGGNEKLSNKTAGIPRRFGLCVESAGGRLILPGRCVILTMQNLEKTGFVKGKPIKTDFIGSKIDTLNFRR